MKRLGWLTRGWTRAAIGIPLSVVLLVVTISRINVDLLANAWSSVALWMVVVAAVISVAEVSVRAVRWQILLAPFTRTSFGSSLGYLTIGHLANTVLPARLGDITRALLAGSQLRVSRMSVLGTIAVERVADAGLLGIAISTGAFIGFTGMEQTLGALLFAGGALALASAVGVLALRHRIVRGSRLGAILHDHGGHFLAGARSLTRPSDLARVVLLTLCSFGLAVVIFEAVAAGVGLPVPLWQAAVLIAAVTLSTAIPAGPASIGPYEFVGMTLMTSMGYAPETSLLCVALVHVAALVPATLMGLGFMWVMGLTFHSGTVAPLGSERAQ